MMKQFIFCLTIAFLSLISSASHAELFVYHDEATDLYGFKDANGNIVISSQFEHIFASHDKKLFSPEDKEYEFLVPVIKKGTAGQIASDGTWKFESVFWDNGPDFYEEGLARFIKDEKVGFHDRKGNVAINPVYDFASSFRDERANVCKGCYAVYPKCKGLTYHPIASSSSLRLREKHLGTDLFPLIVGGKWGMINTQGDILVPLVHSSFEEADKAFNKLNKNRKAK